MTAPYSSRAATAIAQPLEHVWTVEAWPAGATEGIPLEVINGTAAFDEGWSPQVKASLQVKVPEDQDILDALDPRTNCRIRLRAGYVYQNGKRDIHDFVDLGLFSRVVNRPANTMDLEAVGDELRAQGNAAGSDQTPPHTGVSEALVWLIDGAMTPMDPGTIDIQYPEGAHANLLTDLVVKAGSSYWSAISDVANIADLWVYVDGLGQWHIRPRPLVAGQSAMQLAVGPAGTITASEAALTREEWANLVVVFHRWTDSGGNEVVRRGVARVTSGPMAITAVGPQVLVLNHTAPCTQAYVDAEAATILKRSISRGRKFNVESISAYWLRPGNTVTVKLPTGPQERHLVSSVSFRFPAGDMSVQTRVPQNVTITTGE